MSHAQTDPHICALSIAGLGLTLACDQAPLATALRQRYDAFRSDAAPLLTARVTLSGAERTTPIYDPRLIFHDGRAYFTTPTYTGWIDAHAGRAELTISSTYPLEDVEYFVRVIYALLAFRAGGLLFHAAGIAHHERGYLFCGHSGSGKTTVARLSSSDRVLNDDLVVLMPADERWMIHATPFWNPTQVQPGGVDSVALAALLRLVQDTQVFVEPMGPGQALAEVIANVPVLPGDSTLSTALLLRGQRLLQQVPAYRLHFLPDPSFWPVVEALP
jgi:hypothetical protein